MGTDDSPKDAATQRHAIDSALNRSGSLSDMETGFVEEQRRNVLEAGRLLSGRFEIAGLIGAGGMGAVYEARDRLGGKTVALKVMLPSLMASEQARERFTQEAMLTRELRHPGIVAVYDVGADGDLLYLTMELVQGESASDWREKRGGKVDAKNACGFMHKVCEALRFAHEHGVIHRDLKPQNILVIHGGRIRLVDFGLARAVGGGGHARTQAALGTPYYMAPEQARNGPNVDARADIYSCGVILYELVTGELPMGAFDPPSQLDERAPIELDDLVTACLQPRPNRRPACAKELMERLEAVYEAATAQRADARPRRADRDEGPARPTPAEPREPESGLRDSEGGGACAANSAREAGALGEPGRIVIPNGWTSEDRRVVVATPEGGVKKGIAYYRNRLGMEFVYIPAGEFMMGSRPDEQGRQESEGPVHRVEIAKPLYMQAYEVTQAQYEPLMGGNPSHFRGENRPVEGVSWNEAQAFLKALLEVDRFSGVRYRLPTEAEWEYACRAGSQTRFYAGNRKSRLDRIAWYAGNSEGETHEVGEKLPNAFGLHDMIGNAAEWCQSLYMSYPVAADDGREDLRAGGSRALRGGSWNLPLKSCRCASRDFNAPSYTNYTLGLGFRVVAVPLEGA